MQNQPISLSPEVLLIHPPIRDFYQTRFRLQPLGLEYLAASLEKNGISTHILNCVANTGRRTIPVPQNMAYLRPYYPTGDLSPFKVFGHYYHFGKYLEAIEEYLETKL